MAEDMVRPPDRQLMDLLAADDRPVAGLALALREMLLEAAPDAMEKVYRNHPSAVWFGFGPKMSDMFCYIATATSHVNLGFCRGALLPDPNRVLEGEGKVMRHIKFRSERDSSRKSSRMGTNVPEQILRYKSRWCFYPVRAVKWRG